MRVSAATLIAIGAIAALVALGVTDQILPAADPRTISMRPWIAARAMGVTAYLLLALEVALGLVLSHPRNTAEWRKTKQVFPWHEMVTVFTGAFLALHVALLATDPYADVGVIGALVPGYSAYRPVAVGLGSIALYALIFTARDRQVDPPPALGLVAQGPPVRGRRLLLTWMHAVLAGTDGGALLPLYLLTGVPILAGVGHRWWTARVRPARPAARSRTRSLVIERPTAATVATEEP